MSIINKPRNVVIAGCSRLGAGLAYMLSKQGYPVTVIDRDAEAFRKLPDEFDGFTVVGDATSVELLDGIDFKNTYMVFAVTQDDNQNSLMAQVASRIYGIERVYIRLSDPSRQVLIEGSNIRAIYPYLLAMRECMRLIEADTRPQQPGESDL